LLYPEKKTTDSSEEELTEAEKEVVIKEATRKKRELLEYYEKEERRQQWDATLSREWDHNELLMFVQWKARQRGFEIVIDDHNRTVYEALALYYTGNPEFEKIKEGYSLNKGIALCGGVGVGKTTLLGLFRANQRRSFKIVSCRELSDRYAKDGHEMLHIWSNPIRVPTHSDTFYQNEIGVCFDDLGTEDSKRHFGDQVNVMGDILSNRYDRSITPFHYTHLTTNLSAQEIESFYGTRVRSRMREMFNMITLPGEDRRK
jgi:DNA replication protein DnaC